jgi:hypothetical protein
MLQKRPQIFNIGASGVYPAGAMPGNQAASIPVNGGGDLGREGGWIVAQRVRVPALQRLAFDTR